MRNKVHGFTLIELLVVIAIIAILAAILFPIFASAREKGKQTGCMNNMRQITKAYLVYADDWGGFMPPLRAFTSSGTMNPGGTAGDPSTGALWRYYKTAKILLCPSDARKRPGTNFEKFTYSYSLNGGVTWAGYQGYFDNAGRARADKEGMSVSYFMKPSRDILWVDENTDKRDYSIIINDETFINQDRTGKKHNIMANVSFLDGHMGQVRGMMQWDMAKWPDGKWMFFEKKVTP